MAAILAEAVPGRYDYPEAAGPWEAARSALYDLAVEVGPRGSSGAAAPPPR